MKLMTLMTLDDEDGLVVVMIIMMMMMMMMMTMLVLAARVWMAVLSVSLLCIDVSAILRTQGSSMARPRKASFVATRQLPCLLLDLSPVSHHPRQESCLTRERTH